MPTEAACCGTNNLLDTRRSRAAERRLGRQEQGVSDRPWPCCISQFVRIVWAHDLSWAEAMRIEPATEEKSPVNLRIRTSLKNKAKNLGVNLSQTLERSLEDEISRREQHAWLEANRHAIEAYNRRINERGPALSAYRSF